MVTVEEALRLIANSLPRFDFHSVVLEKSAGCYLAEDIVADRDFPACHRVTMDGISLHISALEKGLRQFPIEDTVRAGEKTKSLRSSDACLEVMTGAVLPLGTNVVVPYEQLIINNNSATLASDFKASVMLNIHQKGSDVKEGDVVIKRSTRISAPEIAALASVGKYAPLVFAFPKIAVISTGDELVEIDNPAPKDFQIRKSNPYAIKALIESFGTFQVDLFHINDQQDIMMTRIGEILNKYEMILLSGGVSAGKYDFVPGVLHDLKVKEIFHKIRQRPGKPMWFGKGPAGQLVFGLPGNPVAALFCCRRYVITTLGWLISGGQFSGILEGERVIAESEYYSAKDFSFFRPCRIKKDVASFYTTNGSGDLLALCGSDGFVELPPDREIKAGDEIMFFSWRDQ